MTEMLKTVQNVIQTYQYPDNIDIKAQGFRGWWITFTWYGIKSDLKLEMDWDRGYSRCIGDSTKIPKHIMGIHRYWDDPVDKEIKRVIENTRMDETTKNRILSELGHVI